MFEVSMSVFYSLCWNLLMQTDGRFRGGTGKFTVTQTCSIRIYLTVFSHSIPNQISVELWITHILDDATQCYSFFFSLISSKNVMNSVMIHNSCVISRYVVQFAMRMWSHFSKDSTSFIPLFCVHIFFLVCEKPFQTHKKLWIEPWISLFILLFQRQSFCGMHWKQLSLWIFPLIQQQRLNSISLFFFLWRAKNRIVYEWIVSNRWFK